MSEAALDLDRVRRAQVANIRAELLAPASAMVSYGELLLDEARRQGLTAAAPDLERIVQSARELADVVEDLLNVDRRGALSEDEVDTLQATLRHDVRNLLGAIKGYVELQLEELADVGGEVLRGDLETLLREADNLLANVDAIVDFTREVEAPPGEAAAPAHAGTMVQELVRSIRPLADATLRAAETGSILVVDDNQTNRDLLERRLGREGHRVLTAESGRAALAALENETVDLILLDLIMPDMNGFQFLEHINAEPRFHDIPVIVTSALDDMDSIVRCIEAGADDFLSKPFSPVLLKARINACLERKYLRDRERVALDELKAEKEKSEALLLNVLPRKIVDRLNTGEAEIADRFDSVTVVFADLVSFMDLSSQVSPARLVDLLNRLFSGFDAVCRDYGVEKIKTIGDAYMAVSGLPESRADHASAAAGLALDLVAAVDRVDAWSGVPLKVRVGVHSGPVVAGIIGTHKFAYDVWGDTVNLASRLEQSGVPNRVHVSARTAALLQGEYELEHRGRTRFKGGESDTFFLVGRA